MLSGHLAGPGHSETALWQPQANQLLLLALAPDKWALCLCRQHQHQTSRRLLLIHFELLARHQTSFCWQLPPAWAVAMSQASSSPLCRRRGHLLAAVRSEAGAAQPCCVAVGFWVRSKLKVQAKGSGAGRGCCMPAAVDCLTLLVRTGILGLHSSHSQARWFASVRCIMSELRVCISFRCKLHMPARLAEVGHHSCMLTWRNWRRTPQCIVDGLAPFTPA